MNHIKTIKLTSGKWVMASLNNRGSYIVCGCVNDQGHESHDEAQRHYYDHCLHQLQLPHVIHVSTMASQCAICLKEDRQTWTPKFVMGPFYGRFGGLELWVCDQHVPVTDESLRRMVEEFCPFTPDYEGWQS